MIENKLPAGEPICIAGDLVDRGPKSAQVIEYVKSNNIPCTMGNHEKLFINHMEGEDSYTWMRNGGVQTVESYDGNTELMKEHFEWMKGLPYYLEYRDLVDDEGQHLLVTHSSAEEVWRNKPEELNEDHKDHLIWNRTIGNGPPDDIKDVYNVFGHTPSENVRQNSYFACIDTGCCFAGKFGLDTMTAIQFPSKKLFFQKNVCES
jgi:serine/threonine protein phosphatase 1